MTTMDYKVKLSPTLDRAMAHISVERSDGAFVVSDVMTDEINTQAKLAEWIASQEFRPGADLTAIEGTYTIDTDVRSTVAPDGEITLKNEVLSVTRKPDITP